MKTNTNNRRVAASRIALSVLAVLASAAQAQTVAEWDLPQQPLADSLREVAARTDSNIIFDKTLVAGQSARPLKIRASADEALTQLLEGTGLTYRHLDDRTVTIQSISASQKSTSTGGAADGRIRLAQAETGTSVGSSAEAGRRAPTVEGRQLIDIEEIIVTGTNIRGIQNNTAPVIALTKEYIDATGFGTTTQLVESLPQNFALANQSNTSNVTGVSASREQGASINLRGIGEGTTLVLLNGRRMAPGFLSAAVDVSALPLTAIDRVEILTDGASALYGSDAIGGVVNFILRDDFEGAETRLRGGSGDGFDEYRASQVLGTAWNTGNALLSVEYYKRDLLLASDRDYIPPNNLVGSLLPEDENYSAVFTANQQLADSVSVFADALYTKRETSNRGGRVTFFEDANADIPQLLGTLGLTWQVGGDWQVELAGGYGSYELDITRGGRASATVRNQSDFNNKFESQSAQIKADGTLLTLPGGSLRAALGADWRNDEFEFTQKQPSGAVLRADQLDQIVRSAFAEVYVPVVGAGNAIPGIKSLELSLAGRYDEYSSFGSSFDPQYGLMWEPVGGLRLRARHGTSYKAPNLTDYSYLSNAGAAIFTTDSGQGNIVNYQLQLAGIDVDNLKAQESESSSFGLEFSPASLVGFTTSINYYTIKYDNQIATPPGTGVILQNPAAFGSLFIRDPSVDQVNQFIALANRGATGFRALNRNNTPNTTFTPDQIDVIVDTRKRNLSVVETNGLDLSTLYSFKTSAGRFALGLSGTYVLTLDQQITSTSAEVDRVDTYRNPPHWRARGYASWQLGGWTTNLAVNHTDAYTDDRQVIRTEVESWTTVDARLAYSFTNRFPTGFLSGVTVAANVQNIADEDPPSTALINPATDLGFDSANANPLGRFISLELTKAW